MKIAKGVSLASVAAVVAALVITIGVQSGAAQGDPFVGTWVLNVAKSTYPAGTAPKAQTSVYEASGQGVKVTTSGTSAAGAATKTAFTAMYDGKDYPVTGNPDWDATSLKRVNPNTVEFTRKRGGQVVQTGTNVVSADGKTRTVTTNGVNAQGQKISTVAVYDRK